MAEKLAEITLGTQKHARPLIQFDYSEPASDRWVVNFYLKDGTIYEVTGESMFSVLWIALEIVGFPPTSFIEELFKKEDAELQIMRRKSPGA